MSIVDTTTTTSNHYAGWEVDVPSTGPESTRIKIYFGGAFDAADEVYWMPDDDEEALVFTKPTFWDRVLMLGEALVRPAPEDSEIIDDVTMLSRARHYLSLNTKELAEVMGVERPSIYSWLEGNTKIRKANRERIETVFALAKSWWSRTRKPLGRALHLRGPAGHSLFELLKDPQINTAEILNLFEHVDRMAADAHEAGLAGEEPLARVPQTVKASSIRRLARRGRR